MLRSPGMLFQEQEDGRISNLYNLKVVNKTGGDLKLELRDMSGRAEVRMIGAETVVPSQSLGEAVFFLIMDRSKLTGSKTELEIGVFSNGEKLDQTRATFFGPGKEQP